MGTACAKVLFSRLMRRAQLIDPHKFDFYPETWTLSHPHHELRKAMKGGKHTFIVKPDDGSQGDGISLVQTYKSLMSGVRTSCRNSNTIVQRYLTNPMLIGGLKFDFRVYVGILDSGLDPSKVFLFHEGLARFCTEEYVAPCPGNMHRVMAHLTNYSLNKRSERYNHGSEGELSLDTGTKRLLSGVVQQLDSQGLVSRDAFFQELDRIVSGTYEALRPVLSDNTADLLGCEDQSKANCFFHLLGFDVMLDCNGKAHLLEVNSHPSLQLNSIHFESSDCRCMDSHLPHGHEICLVDEHVKVQVVADLLKLATTRGELCHGDFHQVCCGDGGVIAQVHRLYWEVAGRKMTSQRFRSFLTKAGLVRGQLASHEADVLYLQWQQAVYAQECENAERIEFYSVLRRLADTRFSQAECPLAELVEQVVAAGYQC
eukprot:TRINITY_DN55243_c0_g1_i1.p1 TRINITY_DN55243_c0_g1~~TRINITY_DN55243_c0_g1_i1.p1  ORF type:complete len:428 (+),score=76.50 TRINITY_DN55243_c0_g1_i1:445-1728(+)